MIDGEFIINETLRKDFVIIECNLNILDVSNTFEKLSLHITNTCFKKIKAIGTSNLGYILWNTLIPKIDSLIEITNSSMGKWDIINCDFSNVKLILHGSKITDAFYTNTKFPKELASPQKKVYGLSDNDVIVYEDVENKYDILRDGYNQLKTIAQKQNDRKTYLHFQAAELDSYYQSLDWNKKDIATKFQLWAQKWSSDFGTKWTWGVLFVIGFNLLFVTVCSLDKTWTPNLYGIGNYLTGYFSSLFSLISVPRYFSTDWEIIWFYISRLFIAFGIYQTIGAFRKFGKSE